MITGSLVAIVTPMLEDGRLDLLPEVIDFRRELLKFLLSDCRR